MKLRLLKVDPDVLAPFGEEDERELAASAERLLWWDGIGRPARWVFRLRVSCGWGTRWISDPMPTLRAAWIALRLESCRLSMREFEGVTR